MDNYFPVDRWLSTFHWNLNTDGTGKIAYLGSLPWIARNIQDAFGIAMTGQTILRIIYRGHGSQGRVIVDPFGDGGV